VVTFTPAFFRRPLRFSFVTAVGVATTFAGYGQSPAEKEVGPTPHLTLPLAPTATGSVVVRQSTTTAGGENSVVVLGSTIQTQGQYSGSTPAGEASGADLSLTLTNALNLGLRFNLGAISQSQAVLDAEGARRIARSALLPNLNIEIGEQLEKLNLRIYSLTTLLPLFYQTLMGYDATSAGLAVSPRGLGSIVAAIAAGVLATKLDPRKMVAAGFAILSLSTLFMGQLTLAISPTTLLWPIVFDGLGMSLVFVPLSNVALGTIPQDQVGNASGIYNFLRNIGGSAGISAANTIVQRYLQSHRNENVHWLSGSSYEFHKQLQALAAFMARHAGPRRALLRAFELTSSALNGQAQLWAYVDDFRYLAILCALCIPLAFFLQRPSAESKGAA
jgi:hypothetical protein